MPPYKKILNAMQSKFEETPTKLLESTLKKNRATSLPGTVCLLEDSECEWSVDEKKSEDGDGDYSQRSTPLNRSTLNSPISTVTRADADPRSVTSVTSVSSYSGSPVRQLVFSRNDTYVIQKLIHEINKKDPQPEKVRELLSKYPPGYLSQKCIKLAKKIIEKPTIKSAREKILYLLLEAAYPKKKADLKNLLALDELKDKVDLKNLPTLNEDEDAVDIDNLKTLSEFKDADIYTTNFENNFESGKKEINQQKNYARSFLHYLDSSPIVYLITHAPGDVIRKPNERQYEDQNYQLDVYLNKLLTELKRETPRNSDRHNNNTDDNRCDVARGMFLLYAAQEKQLNFFRQCLPPIGGRQSGVELAADTAARSAKITMLIFKPIEIEANYLLRNHNQETRNQYLEYIEEAKIAAQKDILKNINNSPKLMKVVACAAALRNMLDCLNEAKNDFARHWNDIHDSYKKILPLCREIPDSQFSEYCRIFFLVIVPLFIIPIIVVAVALFTPGIPHICHLAFMYSKPFESLGSVVATFTLICGMTTNHVKKNGTFAHAFSKNTSLFFNAMKSKEEGPTIRQNVVEGVVNHFK